MINCCMHKAAKLAQVFPFLKAAVIRIGLMEMVKYVREFGGDSPILATFFESCGVADLVCWMKKLQNLVFF